MCTRSGLTEAAKFAPSGLKVMCEMAVEDGAVRVRLISFVAGLSNRTSVAEGRIASKEAEKACSIGSPLATGTRSMTQTGFHVPVSHNLYDPLEPESKSLPSGLKPTLALPS